MKTLLLLDGYTLIKQLKLFLGLIAGYAVISLALREYLFLGFSVLFLTLLPYYLIQYSEAGKTDALLLILPCSRETIVTERYLSVLLTLVPSGLLALIVGVFLSWDHAALVASEAAVGICVLSVMLPLALRFGATKSRVILIGGIALLAAMAGGVNGLLAENGASAFFVGGWFSLLLKAMLPLALAVLAVSWRISLKIYEKKEF